MTFLPRFCLFLAAGIAVTLFSSCDPKPSPETAHANENGDERIFRVRGVVQELSADDPARIVIDHEEMPGYMGAMIMPFHSREPEELEGLTPGDVVTFDYHVRSRESWIANLTATGETGEIKSIEAGESNSVTRLSEGELLPDYSFVDETGADIKLSELRGMPVALTFVFSRCPVPEYCPAMMHNFNTVRTLLEEDPDAPPNYRLLTISFDTANDTPEIMKQWGAAFGHQDGQSWSLLTTEDSSTIGGIGGNVGLKFGEVNGSYQHNLRTAVLDPEGKIHHLFTDETWTPEALVAEIKAAASASVSP